MRYNIWIETLEDKKTKLLRALYPSEKENRKDQNPVRVPGTCEWFTNHQDFRNWETSPSMKMLWVSADPGSGKSVLAKYLIDSVLCLPTHKPRTICYFFFKDNFEGGGQSREAGQGSAVTALCCILLQLFTAKRSLLCEKILDQFDIAKTEFPRSFDALWSALLIAAKNNANAGEIVCVLDALDECNSSDRSRLITKLTELYRQPASGFNLKILVTSRPIREVLHALRSPKATLKSLLIHLDGDGDEEKEKICQEIDLFIDARVHEISTKLQLGDTKKHLLLERLKHTPNRTYLWVYLILDLIEKDPNVNIGIDEDTIDSVTSQLPQTIDEAYEKILSASCKHDEAKKILQIVVAATRPLTLKEMYVAFNLKADHQSYGSFKGNLSPEEIKRFGYDVRDRCGLFVRVMDSKIYLIHQTAREFLVRREKEGGDGGGENLACPAERSTRWKDSLRMQHCHQLLASICMQHLLNFTEFETNPFTGGTNLSDYAEEYPFINYSANNWVVHLQESQADFDKTNIQSILQLCDTTTIRSQTWLRIYWLSTDTDFPVNITTLMVMSYFGFAPAVKFFLESGYNIGFNYRDGRYGRSALSWAAGNGSDAVVTQLLKGYPWKGLVYLPLRIGGPEIDSVDKHGRTPLIHAILNKRESVANQLLKAGARADLADKIGATPLYYAICSGQNELAAEMLKKGNQVTSEDSIRKDLLFSAALGGYKDAIELLLEGGKTSPDEKDVRGRTALMVAAKFGHLGVAELLLNNGADLWAKDTRGQQPLAYAADYGRKEVVQLLLDRGASIEARYYYDKTPLMVAAEGGYEKVVELLLNRGASIEARCYYDKTPLTLAAEGGYEKVVELLLNRGASIEARCYYDKTPLTLAAEGGYEKVVELLLNKGASIETRCYSGKTPLMLAARGGYEGVVELLLNRGADVEAQDHIRWTALAYAMKCGHKKVARLLVDIDRGASIEAKKYYDSMLLMLVRWEWYERAVKPSQNRRTYSEVVYDGLTSSVIAATERNIEVMKSLLDKGANIEAKDYFHQTPLLIAVGRGDTRIIEFLLNNGADLEAKDSTGWTSLHIAVKMRFDWVAGLLIKKGANIEANNGYGWTPLIAALKQGYTYRMVQLLLDEGADKEARDEKGWTPLLIASKMRDKEIVELLLNKDADVEAKGAHGQTSLVLAVKSGNKEVVRWLLDKGANMEAKDVHGQTSLVLAVESGNKEVVRWLLDKGANMEVKNRYGKGLLLIAGERYFISIAELLLVKGINTEAQDDNGQTPLKAAMGSVGNWFAALLLKYGADTEVKDINGETALFPAIRLGLRQELLLLLNKGADMRVTNNQGISPLMLALKSKLPIVMQHVRSDSRYKDVVSS
ncbi:hypothetical protein TWF718_009558 [Orbilia javanica]|uniref:NACHT domain-containing protein n=1 Tax=Orbilia javanica TaxID=47235 RepID=A0AAN8MQ14_9PEZI